MKLKKEEKLILQAFLECPIPSIVKTESIKNLDLMLCYEELCNYVYELIKTGKVNKLINSYGSGESFIFDGTYENILLKLISNQQDKDVKIHCMLSLSVLYILEKY